MFKRTSFSTVWIGLTFAASAQVTPTAHMFQNNMAPFQATALPYNYLDKFEQEQDESPIRRRLFQNQKANLDWYVNASTRIETYPESANATKNTTVSGVYTVDRILRFDKRNYKIGGGIMHQDLQIVQLNAPFLHGSAEIPLAEHWRIWAGANYRFSQSRLNTSQLNYQHPWDDKIKTGDRNTITAMDAHNSNYHSIGMSVAAIHTQRAYIGLGMNRILGANQFRTAQKESFTEFNLLCQAIVWKRYKSNFVRNNETGKKVENPNRGFLSNVSVSVAARYLYMAQSLNKYPAFVQVNCRTTLMNQLWFGAGWNTANRLQIQLGLMQLPLFKQNIEKEWAIWVAYDFPNQNAPYHGSELNLSYYF